MALRVFVGRSDWGHDLCNISFCYLFLLHDGPEHGMNKAVLSSKCIHSFNEFLKIMELLLGNGEIIHSQRPMQSLAAEVALGMGVGLWNPPPRSLEGHLFICLSDLWFPKNNAGRFPFK